MSTSTRLILGLVVWASMAVVSPAGGAVVCQKRSGVVVVRDEACKRKEKALDLAQFGALGPKGDPGDPGMPGPPGAGPLTMCPPDAVLVGPTCVDTYEASVWRVPGPTGINTGLVTKIQQGTATAADLTAGAATQLGAGGTEDYAPCVRSGQTCTNDIYAVSLPGVPPSASVTWFQAQQACTNARKRLPSNAEWQAAVAGTPDPGPDNGTTDCNTLGGSTVATGSRSACVSSRGAFDMVGNVFEWVADWVPRSTMCGTWNADVSPTGDFQCLAGADTTGEPGALLRGGGIDFGVGSAAGPLSVRGDRVLSTFDVRVGFRCAR